MTVKEKIKISYEPPKAKGRDEFLCNLNYPKLTKKQSILSQLGYIRKRVWVVALIVMLLGIYMICMLSQLDGISVEMWLSGIWLVSALTPFLAMITASEISRSDCYGMLEIEASTRFGIQQLIGARLLILGITNFIVAAGLAFTIDFISPIGIITAALFILAPFSLVCALTLRIYRRFRGQDGIFLSAAIAVVVASAQGYLSLTATTQQLTMEIGISTIVLVIGLYGIVRSIRTSLGGRMNMEVNQ